MYLSKTQLSQVLKTVYLYTVADSITRSNLFIAHVKSGSEYVYGKDIRPYFSTEDGRTIRGSSRLKTLYVDLTFPLDLLKRSQPHLSDITEAINFSLSSSLQKATEPLSLAVLKSNYDITGLDKLFDLTSPLYGINREECSNINPTVVENFGEITQEKLELAKNDKTDFILCNPKVKTALVSDVLSRGSNLDYISLDAGYKALSSFGVPVVTDKHCPIDEVYLLSTEDFYFSQLCDWLFLEDAHGEILRESKKGLEATLVKYGDLICKNPKNQIKLKGVQS